MARGEGPGPITADGCSVDVYLELPYRGEVELLSAYLPAGCSVLDLGCATGRLTRRLLERGHRVTAVDNSPEMLRHVPDAATKVCGDIERLALDPHDVVLLASHLINLGTDAARQELLGACRRHVAPDGVLLFQRFDPEWLRALEPGPFPTSGAVGITIDRAAHSGDMVDISIRYTLGEREWKHHFRARVLDDDATRDALDAAGFGSPAWIDSRWGAARPARFDREGTSAVVE